MAERTALLLIVGFMCAGFSAPATAQTQDETKHDQGYVFSGAHVDESIVVLANGLMLVPNHQSGVIVSENPEGPWHHATFFSQGTTIRHADGKTIADIALNQSTDPEGDSTWSIHA